MPVGPSVALSLCPKSGLPLLPGAPLAQGQLGDVLLPVGLSATVLGLGQDFTGDNLVFSLAPSSDPLPAGLSLDTQGVLFGTPTEAATREIVLRATNGSGDVDSALTLVTFELALDVGLSGLTANPAFGPSAQIGTTLTAALNGVNGPPSGAASYQWHTLESGAIPGATGATYAIDTAAYDGQTLYCAITAAPYPEALTMAAVIRQPPPVATGALPDEIFDLGTGPQTVPTAQDFSGADLTFSVAGPSVSIDPDTGVLTIETNSARNGAQIVVTATNSGGSVSSSFLLTVETVDGGFGLMDATQTMTVRGVTFFFDRSVQVGYYADTGEPFVRSNQAFAITQITPGAANANGYWGWGAMKFAGDGSDVITSGGQPQGFDQRIGATATNIAGTITYSSSVNVDPDAHSNNSIQIAAGESCTIIKATRNGTGGSNSIGEFVILTIQPGIPPENALRPGACYCDAIQFAEDDIDLSVLPGLTPPATVPSVQACLNNLSPNASARMFEGWGGERQRRIEDQTTQNLKGSGSYSGDYALDRSMALYKICESGLATADYMELAKAICRIGLDVAVNYMADTSANYGRGAGQWHGYHSFVWFAGMLLRSNTLLDVAKAIRSNMQSHPRWVTQALIGRPLLDPYWPGGNTAGKNWYNRVFDETDLGKPDWIGENGFYGASQPGAYKTISLPVGTIELLPVLLLQNSPNGRTGEQEFLRADGGDGSYSNENRLAAAIAVMDRWQTWTNDPDNERDFNSTLDIEYEDYYAAWRPLLAAGNWSGVPDCPDLELFSVGSGAGEIDWNAVRDHATETITDRHIAYSLDNIQFVVLTGQSTVGTLSLLEGTQHFVKYRAVSASGPGKWTRSGIRMNDQEYGVYGRFTTTGTPSGAQAFTVTPAVHYRTYPTHEEPIYTEASGTLPKYVTRLFAGAGYVSGDVSVGFAYQWQRNDGGGWADLAGETGQSYDIDPETDQGVDFRCVVTCGGASAATNTVTVNVGATIPAGTIIDTNFDGDFFLDYPGVYKGLRANSASLSREPNRSIDGSSEGAVIAYKFASQPRLFIEDLPALSPSTDYEFQIEIIEGFGNWNNTGYVELESQNNPNTDYAADRTGVYQLANLDSPNRKTFAGTFRSSGSDPSIRVRVVNRSQTGLSSGGNIAVTRFMLREI